MSEFASEGSAAAEEEVRHIRTGDSEIDLGTSVDQDKAEWPGAATSGAAAPDGVEDGSERTKD